MARFHLTYSSVPELRPLSREERIRVLRMSGAAHGKTPAFRMTMWGYVLLCVAAPVAAGVLGYLAFGELAGGILPAVVTLFIGYAIWFHTRLTQLRPFIRRVLDGTITEEPPYYRVERWQDAPQYWIPTATLYFGGFMGAVLWLTEERWPWWLVLSVAIAVGLFFGTATWFVHRYFKGR